MASTQTPSGQFRLGLIVSSSLFLSEAMARQCSYVWPFKQHFIDQARVKRTYPEMGRFRFHDQVFHCALCFSLYLGFAINQNCWNVMLTHSDIPSNFRLFNEVDPQENKQLPGTPGNDERKVWRLYCFFTLVVHHQLTEVTTISLYTQTYTYKLSLGCHHYYRQRLLKVKCLFCWHKLYLLYQSQERFFNVSRKELKFEGEVRGCPPQGRVRLPDHKVPHQWG